MKGRAVGMERMTAPVMDIFVLADELLTSVDQITGGGKSYCRCFMRMYIDACCFVIASSNCN